MNKTIYLQHYCSDNYDMVNMNTIQKLFICFLFLVLFLPKLPAQDYTVGKSIISLQIGPSRYVGTFLGIADFSKNYRSDLRDGLSWNAGYSYIFGKPGRNCNFGLGLMYQGTRYKHSASDVSDDISMQYLAPQFILHFARKRYNIQLAYGSGFLWYKDDSGMYGKPRKVDMDEWAFSLSAGGEYYLASWCGLCAKLNWIVSESKEYSVSYHGETWTVNNPELSNGGGTFAPLSFTVGMNFHF